MSKEYCIVCATNEGIFLDIFATGKNFREIIETCLSVKIYKKRVPSSKICHKCAYELDQCSKFVERYKKTYRTEKGKLCKKRGLCSVCMEPGKNGRIFQLNHKNPLDNSTEELGKLFKIDFINEDSSNWSICLNCRYNLDVVSDLKHLYKNTSSYLSNIINGDVTSSQLSKTSTRVVRRKTTSTRIPKFFESKSSSDSDASTVIVESHNRMPALTSRKMSPYERKCDTCKIKIVNGMDMYRFHHSGETVCKECWMTMDPCEKIKSKNCKLNNEATKTKLCSVYLTDILSDSVDSKRRDGKIEKITDSEIITLSSESEDEDEKESLSARLEKKKRKKRATANKSVKKLKIAMEPKMKRITRSNSVQCINAIDKKNTRLTRSESGEKSESDGKLGRKRTQIAAKPLASTSNSIEVKKRKESLPRNIKTNKRTRNSSPSIKSRKENSKWTKTRRFSSPSSKINSDETNIVSDIDDSDCFIHYNKNMSIDKKLKTTKKLEVLLEKVIVPDTMEMKAIAEREPSTEFDSPSPSHDEPPNICDSVPTVTDESAVQDLSDIPHDKADNNKRSHSVEEVDITIDNENKDKKYEDQLKNNEEKNEPNEDISPSSLIQSEKSLDESDKNIMNDVVSAAEKIEDIASEKSVDETPASIIEVIVESTKIDSNVDEKSKKEATKIIVEDVDVDKNVNEQDIENMNLSYTEKNTEVNEKEVTNEIEADKNELQAQPTDQIEKKIESKITNEEKNHLNHEVASKKVECLEKNSEPMKQNEKDTVSQTYELAVDRDEKLTDETCVGNEENDKDDKTTEKHSKDSDNGIFDEMENTNKTQETIVEDNAKESIFNGDIDIVLSAAIDTILSTGNEVAAIEVTKYGEASDEVAECHNVDISLVEEEANSFATDKIDNDVETVVKDLVGDDNIDSEENKEATTEVVDEKKNNKHVEIDATTCNDL